MALAVINLTWEISLLVGQQFKIKTMIINLKREKYHNKEEMDHLTPQEGVNNRIWIVIMHNHMLIMMMKFRNKLFQQLLRNKMEVVLGII